MATHSSVLAWRIPGTGSLVGCRLWGCTESDTTEAMQQQQQQGVYGVSLIAQMVKIHLSMQVIRFNPWVVKIPVGGNGYPLQYSKIPWAEEPEELQSIESHRVEHN